MKILHVVPSFGLGGMEKIICTVINSTINTYDHELLSLDNKKEAVKWISIKNIALIDFHKPTTRYKFFQLLYTAIHKSKPNLLMTYNWGATDAIWLGRLAGIKNIIHHEHGFNIDEAVSLSWKRAIIRFLVYCMASKIIVVSTELARIIRNKFRLSAKKIIFIPNGINNNTYVQNTFERDKIRKELNIKDTDFVVGFSGRLDPVKNFDLMTRIFAHCLGHDAHFKFLLIGDGPERKRIEAICHHMNIQNSVIMIGQKGDVLPYLRALDAFLLTSHREQMPMTILEAMSVGIPVVASRVGDIPHIIDDGTDGFLVSPKAAPETWSCLLSAMQKEAQHKHMGALARQKIIDKFQEETMIRSYQHVIESVIHS